MNRISKTKSVEKLSDGTAFAHTSKDLVCTRKNLYLKICPERMGFFSLPLSLSLSPSFSLSLCYDVPWLCFIFYWCPSASFGTPITSLYAGFYRFSEFSWCKYLSPELVEIFYLWTLPVNHYYLKIWSISMSHYFQKHFHLKLATLKHKTSIFRNINFYISYIKIIWDIYIYVNRI